MKKIPMRKCVVTNEKFPKIELVRIVKNNQNEVLLDTTGKINGRGAYIRLTAANIKKAKEKKILDRVLEITIPEEIFTMLEELNESKNS